MVQNRFRVSERFACKAVGQHRSTQRLPAPVAAGDEAVIREQLRAFAKKQPRWGWRRAATYLRQNGHTINNKRVRRLWRDEGLRVPQKRRKKRLTGVVNHVGAFCPIRDRYGNSAGCELDQTTGPSHERRGEYLTRPYQAHRPGGTERCG